MKKLFDLGNRYAAQSTWKDFALTKFCLCAVGTIIGACIPEKHRKSALAVAGGIFAATYVPLMSKIFRIAKDMWKEKNSEE